jgi:small-conductance mechanosensitive channel
MTILPFQEATPVPPPPDEWLTRARETFEETLTSAAEETGGFIIDIGSTLAALVWVAAVVLIVIWVGRRLRRWITGRANLRWPDRPNRATLVDQVLQIAFVVLGVLFGLRVLGISTDSLVTAVGIIVAALSIALQDVLKNLVAGMYLLVEQPFRYGDRLVIPGVDGGQDGWVERTHMRVTELRNAQRELMLVPNYILFSQIVINRTAAEPYALSLRLFMIDSPAAQVEGEIQETVLDVVGPGYTPPMISLMGVGPFGVAADVRIWFTPDLGLRREVIVALNARYPEAVIEVVSG